MKNLVEYLKNKRLYNYTVRGILVSQPNLESETDYKSTIVDVFNLLPNHFLDGIKEIRIALTKEMEERDIQAYYKNNIIYITHELRNKKDLMDDLVHEIAHAVEDKYKNLLYQDGTIEKEFLIKRKQLFDKLNNEGLNPKYSEFINPKYQRSLDDYFYKKVGYRKMWTLIGSIFYSPYAATSLREYFAMSFEAIFYRNKILEIKKISPSVFKKIEEVTNENRKNNTPKFT